VVDMANDVLKQLDDRIQASVTRLQQLQRENEQLAKQLAESEHRYHEASAQLKDYEAARTEVKGRLEKILARFDGLDLG
jgi:septal ring factor EnvC (AmiA/AmiB activator)